MSAVGIDIGKRGFVLCTANAPQRPRDWPTLSVAYEGNWHTDLLATVPPGAIVAIEPTGFHYMQPIATVLEHHARIWQIPTTATEHARIAQVSKTKTDKTDAQALALIAAWIAEGNPPPGAYPFHAPTEHAVTGLRLLVNDHARMTRTTTRLRNQLDALAFSLWPALPQAKATWLRAVSVGAITPAEIHALAEMPERDRAALVDYAGNHPYQHRQADTHLHKLAARLPDIEGPAPIRAAIARLAQQVARQEHAEAELLAQITSAIEAPPFGPITERWSTIPASSPLAIAALHVATRGRAETYTKDQFRAAVGGQPKRRESGEGHTQDRTKAGYKPAINALFMWTLALLSPALTPNPIADYHAKVGTQYKLPAAISKLARVLWGVAHDPAGYHYP